MRILLDLYLIQYSEKDESWTNMSWLGTVLKYLIEYWCKSKSNAAHQGEEHFKSKSRPNIVAQQRSVIFLRNTHTYSQGHCFSRFLRILVISTIYNCRNISATSYAVKLTFCLIISNVSFYWIHKEEVFNPCLQIIKKFI